MMPLRSLSRIFLLTCALLPIARAVESLPAGAWSYSGYQTAPVPPEVAIPLHRDIVAIAGGETHSIALTRDGQVIAWGANFDRQLDIPERVKHGVSAIAAGGRFSAALKNGSVSAWGGNSLQMAVPIEAESGVTAMAAGQRHMLALKANGSILAWGANDYGQCTVPPEATGNVIAMAAGESHSLALKADGSVVAWGTDRPHAPAGEVMIVPEVAKSGVVAIAAAARYSIALKADGSAIVWNGGLPPGETLQMLAPGSGVTAISAGRHHIAFLTQSGGVAIYLDSGWFDYGQTNTPPEAFSGVTAISAGHNHTLALKDGKVIAWGAGSTSDEGQLMVPYIHRGQCAPPAAMAGEVTAIAASFAHTLALTADGRVVAWGNNPYGETDVPASALSGVKAIAVGNFHCVALKADGGAIAWGRDLEGQSTVPEAAQTGVKAIAAGGNQTAVVKEDGSVVAWGEVLDEPVIVPAEAQAGVKSLTAGYEFVAALKENGSVIAWGRNDFHQIDVPAAAGSGVTAIAAGAEHTLALKDDGSVVAWGSDYFGQSTVPTAALSGVVAIAAGESHSVALKDNGSVITWGSNFDGQVHPGLVAGKASAIAAGGWTTFRKLIKPWPSFQEATALVGLSGAEAEPDAMPFKDGVPNLLKYAFNLSLARPYALEIFPGVPFGLPVAELVNDSQGSRWRVEFIRRKDERLTYTPVKSTGLGNGSFVPLTAEPSVQEVPGHAAWERVIVEEPVDLSVTPRFFGRVEVR